MKVKFMSIVIISILISSCSIHKLKKNGNYQELSYLEYNTYVNDSSVNIIDVRTPKEFNKSHIKGAYNWSFFGGDFKRELKKAVLDTSKITLIYCQTQHRSLFVANKLYKAGFHCIIDLDKGMRVWQKNNMPLVGDTLQ